MPLSPIKFLGSSVRGLSSSVGWNMGSPSQLSVQLVEDPLDGDAFSDPGVGTPVNFQLGAYRFSGLLQKWGKREGPDGAPTYEAVVVDPREILDGTQLVLAGYSGVVGTVTNLVNVYGYWESLGFGLAQANEGGIPYSRVRTALLNVCNQPNQTAFGGPLTFRGVKYAIDLSQLPAPPASYRVGGPSISLLELVALVCEDGGCDFFVELVGFTIRVRTVARRNQPPLGTISALTGSDLGGTLLRSSSGVECRNEITSSFLVGGEVTTLWMNAGVTSFWGYDFLGAPITGAAGVWEIRQEVANNKKAPGTLLASIPTEYMSLNASPVAGILGRLAYPCSTLEMRLAKESYVSWAVFMSQHRPDWAARIGVVSTFKNAGVLDQVLKADVVPAQRAVALAQAKQAVTNDEYRKSLTMYEFVRGYAENYMGKKFLVALPFVLQRQDAETLRVSTSWEITDGGWLAEGASPLGLSAVNADVFRNQDGRYRAFVKYTDLGNAELANMAEQGIAIENGGVFVECQVDQNLVYAPGACALVTLNNPIFEKVVDMTGDAGVMAAIFQGTPEQFKKLIEKNQFGNVGAKIHPAHKTPSLAAVPLRSNTATYGPWYSSGASGKTRFEQDQSLVPWNYGSYEAMNAVGLARVSESLVNMTLSEAGDVEVAGVPVVSLGDTLRAGGPNVTGIQVSYGANGYTTTYQFQTYTPRFGVFSRGASERLKRLSLTGQQLRRALRTQGRQDSVKAGVLAGAVRAANILDRAPKQVKKQSPHEVLMSYGVEDAGYVRSGISSMTLEEAVSAVSEDDAEWQATACVGWNGLLRPYTNGAAAVSGVMPGVSIASGDVAGLTAADMDHWGGANDVEAYAWGDSYEDLNPRSTDPGSQSVRVLGLRGPVTLVGWGYDVEGKPVPGSGGSFSADYRRRPEAWKAGPVDHLWDHRRGVWTSHDAFVGTAASAISENATGGVRPQGSTQVFSNVKNVGADVGSGDRVVVLYDREQNGLVALPAKSGGSSSFHGARVASTGVQSMAQQFTAPSADGDRNIAAVLTNAATEFNTGQYTASAGLLFSEAGSLGRYSVGGSVTVVRATGESRNSNIVLKIRQADNGGAARTVASTVVCPSGALSGRASLSTLIQSSGDTSVGLSLYTDFFEGSLFQDMHFSASGASFWAFKVG